MRVRVNVNVSVSSVLVGSFVEDAVDVDVSKGIDCKAGRGRGNTSKSVGVGIGGWSGCRSSHSSSSGVGVGFALIAQPSESLLFGGSSSGRVRIVIGDGLGRLHRRTFVGVPEVLLFGSEHDGDGLLYCTVRVLYYRYLLRGLLSRLVLKSVYCTQARVDEWMNGWNAKMMCGM